MILPARIADIDGSARLQALQIVSPHLERAGAAKRFCGDDTAFGKQCGLLAEEQGLHGLVIGTQAFDWLVAARRHGFESFLFGDLDGAEQRDFPVVIKVDANAKINLGCAGVGIEGFVQAENGVAWRHFYSGEDRRGHGQSLSLQVGAARFS